MIVACRQSFLASKIDEKRRLQESVNTNHITGLPPQLLHLFRPRDPPRFIQPLQKKPHKLPYSGVGHLVKEFSAPGDSEYQSGVTSDRPPEPPRRLYANREFDAQARLDAPSKLEHRISRVLEKDETRRSALQAALESYDPNKDPNIEGDPFKTLFIGRLSYDVTERKLKREFEEYGPIKRVRIVHDRNSAKPKGYAFIEYEHASDMKAAYKDADGRKIEGHRVLVDVERGRTVPGWRPRRLGGGKGGETRASKPPKDPTRRYVFELVQKTVEEKERLLRPPSLSPPPPALAPPEEGEADGRYGDSEKEEGEMEEGEYLPAEDERKRGRDDFEDSRDRKRQRW